MDIIFKSIARGFFSRLHDKYLKFSFFFAIARSEHRTGKKVRNADNFNLKITQ